MVAAVKRLLLLLVCWFLLKASYSACSSGLRVRLLTAVVATGAGIVVEVVVVIVEGGGKEATVAWLPLSRVLV